MVEKIGVLLEVLIELCVKAKDALTAHERAMREGPHSVAGYKAPQGVARDLGFDSNQADVSVVVTPPEDLGEVQVPDKAAAKLHRESLKKTLREKEISFTPSAKTTTLEKLLAVAEEAEKPHEVTKDEVRAKLIELSAVKGKDVALKVLHDLGLEKLGMADPSHYANILAKCQGAM